MFGVYHGLYDHQYQHVTKVVSGTLDIAIGAAGNMLRRR